MWVNGDYVTIRPTATLRAIEEATDDLVISKVNRSLLSFVYGFVLVGCFLNLTGSYPKWSTFIQSISLPQGPKAELFAKCQEATRKDVERAFGVLQARFAIVKNPALTLDKTKVGKIMRACIILHNMIVEYERDGYTQYNISEFEEGDGSRSSQVDMSYSTETPTNLDNMVGIRTHVRDRRIHEQLKNDLIENVWNKFGPVFGGIRVTGSKEFVEQGRKSFNLTCSTVLTKGFILAVVKRGFAMGPILNIQPYNLCDLITCPVSPGSFVITFRKLYPVPITWHIDTSIVLDAGPGKIVNGVTVPADGSMCANISDWYFRNRGGP
ncbi:unnamed protein product [Brassica oleracea var. botrytis]